ncbi:MAG TPA: hypothetical protein VM010_01340, partial [Chitinophagaceae bacterium]|nr:hypothetical protein [Chitinophagaceae bacterium]
NVRFIFRIEQLANAINFQYILSMKFVKKHLSATGFFMVLSFYLHAQDTVSTSTFLLEHIVPGRVLLKSGNIEEVPLNYNAAKQGIVFLKDQKAYDLTGLETVDTVYINDRKFVPVKNTFYEVATTAPVELYATYTCKMQPVTATADNNGSSRKNTSQVSNTVSEVYLNRPYRGNYAMEFHKHFWLRRYRVFYKIGTERQVAKLFPRKESAIRTFVKTNKINLSNEADVVKLIAFCTRD